VGALGVTGDGSRVWDVPFGGVLPNTLCPRNGRPWEWQTLGMNDAGSGKLTPTLRVFTLVLPSFWT